MTTIIMMFLLPIGIITYYWDKKNYANNIRVFHDYVVRILESDMPSSKKLDTIDEMFYQNNYKRIAKTSTTLIVEKKHFNLGVLLIFLGTMTYFGVIFYLIYFYYILKPRRIEIDFDRDFVLKEMN